MESVDTNFVAVRLRCLELAGGDLQVAIQLAEFALTGEYADPILCGALHSGDFAKTA